MRYRPMMTAMAGVSMLALAGVAGGQAAAPAPTPAQAAPRSVQVRAGSLPLVRTMDERFQSFQLGFSHLTGGDTWISYDNLKPGTPETRYSGNLDAVREARAPTDLGNPRLRMLVKALSPLYIRYGGTTTNTVYFQDNDEPKLAKAPDGYKAVLTRERWRGALDFAKAVDARIYTGFSVGSGVRDAAGVWTPVHANAWLAYNKSIGGQIYAAEMFNEPNLAAISEKELGKYPPAEFARDYAVYRAAVNKAAPEIKLVGPSDVATGEGSMAGAATTEDYLKAQPAPRFDIISYHYYPALAERCAGANSPRAIKAENALSEEWLARQDAPFQLRKRVRDRYAPGAPIWNTETGAAACGGPQWQPNFIDTFRFIDTQARLAKQGLDAIFTHAIISGSNGVIDEKTFIPNPDYWAALLWRKLVGTQVLDAGAIRPGLHVYAHCLRGTPGGVTLMALNLEGSPASIAASGPADVYALTGPELLGKTVLLNGKALALGADDTLPAIVPAKMDGRRITLAGHSVNFIALPQARNARCTSPL